MHTILGSTGFVGSALQDRLKSEGKNVTGLSRPEFDLGIPATYSSIPEQTRILIHSAGPAGPEHDESRYWKECVQATYDLVEFINSERKKIELFVYVSSGAVYKPSMKALTEQSETGPGNLYGMTRLLSETIISNKARCRALHWRLFFPYGPGQLSPRLIPELLRKVKAGETINLNGADGLPILNPVFIDDLCAQMTAILSNQQQDIYNLGGSEPLSIRQIAEEIGRAVGREPVFKVTENESLNFHCSASKQLPTSFAAGLQKILEGPGYV